LMVVEPPSEAFRAGILEINDCILVRIKQLSIEQLSSAVHHALISKLRFGINALAVEARKHGGRAGSVKAPIMKAN